MLIWLACFHSGINEQVFHFSNQCKMFDLFIYLCFTCFFFLLYAFLQMFGTPNWIAANANVGKQVAQMF